MPTPILRKLSATVLAAGICAISASAQPQPRTPTPSSKALTAVPRDFDARVNPGAFTGMSRNLTRATEVLNRRRAEAEAFISAETAGRPGTRVTLNRHGVAKVFMRDGGLLSGAMGGAPEDIARNFIRYNRAIFPFSQDEIDGFRLAKKDVSDGVSHLTFQQTASGVDVFEGQIKVTVAASGEVVQVAGGESTPGITVSGSRRLNASEAGATSITYLKGQTGAGVLSEPELNVFPLDSASGRLAYRAFIGVGSGDIYEVVVDAENGSLLYLQNLAVNAGHGTVWTKHPSTADTRKSVDFPDSWLAAGQTVTTGNNADVYLDRNYDLLPDTTSTAAGITGGRASSATQAFDFPFGDGTVNLDPRQYQAAAVTNAFYFINVAHDYFYGLGFTEAAGNFQNDNGGKGGAGGDYVKGLAQYGGFTNNASMSTPKEGISPTLKLGLFTRGSAGLTDDFDADYSGMTIMHEYGHGVSNRLVGSGATSCLYGLQSGSMGEGWSDYFAVSYFNNPVIGAYEAQNTVRGIRRMGYDSYVYRYDDIGNSGYEVHDDGEIWAGVLWDLRKTLGQSIADRLVFNGLKLTACRPSMTDGRDAILAADVATNSGANRTNIWTVFARHGMGYSANGKDGDIDTGQRYDAAYDLPPDLQTIKNPTVTSDPLLVVSSPGAVYNYAVVASNPNNGTLTYTLNSGPAGMMVDSATGFVQWTGTFTPKRVKITVSDGQGGAVVHGFMTPAATPLTPGTPVVIDGELDSTGYAYIYVPSGTQILQVTLRGSVGDPDMYVFDPDGVYDQSGREGANETLTYVNPKPGEWWIEVDGYYAYSGVRLTASFVVPETLTSGTRAGLYGATSSELLYKITVPASTAFLKVATSGGAGDVDIFLRRGAPAVCQEDSNVTQGCYATYYSNWASTNNENITVVSPAAGDWYLDLHGYGLPSEPGFSDVALTTVIGSTGLPSVTLSGAVGTTYTEEQTVSIPNSLSATGAWTAQVTASWQTADAWLGITKNGVNVYTTLTGSGDALFYVVAKPPQAAGTYNGSITVTGSQSAPVTINVSIVVTSAGAATLVRTGALSHIAAGAEWQTSLSLLNTSATAVTAQVVFHADDGAAWSMPLAVTVGGTTSQLTSSTVNATIPARSTLVIAAGPGMATLAVGSAEVLSDGPLRGYAIFRSTGADGKISEGTVPLQTDFQSTVTVPFDNLNGNAMGIALMNLGSSAALTVTAYDETGQALTPQASPIQLAGSGHSAFVLSTQAPATAGKRGYVVFTNPSGSLAGLGLRFIPYDTFTSVPAISPVTAAATSTLVRAGALSHIAAGAEWQTSLSLVNTSGSDVTARVVFRTDTGANWSMPLNIMLAGTPSQATSYVVEKIIPKNSTLVVSVGAEMSQLAVGSAEVLSNGPVSGYAIFRSTGSDGKISEGTVPLQTNLPASMIVPFDNLSGNAMGIALENLGNSIAPLVVRAWDETGNPLGSETIIQFAAAGHSAFVLAQQLPATAGKRGYVKFQNPLGTLSGLGLRFIPYGTFTSVPSILP